MDTSDSQFSSEEQKKVLDFIKKSKVTAASIENTVKLEKSNPLIVVTIILLAAAAIITSIAIYVKRKTK